MIFLKGENKMDIGHDNYSIANIDGLIKSLEGVVTVNAKSE